MSRLLATLVLAWIALPACAPELSVGEWVCSKDGAAIPEQTDPVTVPWSTSFENRFCDYTELAGFCYTFEPGSYEIVTSPVHSGRRAAAFKVNADDPVGHQARCVRQGVLPAAAYYGAWYFLPTAAETTGVWNLVHLQGGDPADLHGLWDISLVNNADGDLEVVLFDFLGGVGRSPTSPTPVPIGSWFHLELYLLRAADATGQVELYQDGQLLIQASNIVTDDSNWGQWYVGNYADGLSPAEFTLYVDDVTIRASR